MTRNVHATRITRHTRLYAAASRLVNSTFFCLSFAVRRNSSWIQHTEYQHVSQRSPSKTAVLTKYLATCPQFLASQFAGKWGSKQH
eukprot:7702201-Pyramimonas_sp.AAC.1